MGGPFLVAPFSSHDRCQKPKNSHARHSLIPVEQSFDPFNHMPYYSLAWRLPYMGREAVGMRGGKKGTSQI